MNACRDVLPTFAQQRINLTNPDLSQLPLAS
jgi:hypothetical protein